MGKKKNTSKKSGKVRVLIAGGASTGTLNIIKSCLVDGVSICGIVAHKNLLKQSAQQLSIPLWYYDQLDDPDLIKASSKADDRYEACLRSILSDPRTAYFCERFYGVKWHHSVFNHTVQIESACWNSLAILNQARPDRLVFMNVTHQLMTWIFGRCAEFLGIPTHFVVLTPLPWRYWAVRGIDEHKVVSLDGATEVNQKDYEKLSSRATQFVENITKSYEVGMPSNFYRLLTRMGGRAWSWKREIRQALAWRPAKLVANTLRIKRKYTLFNTYNSLVHPIRIEDPYIVFFLHYQPEATTLPLGYGYVQQWLAVRTMVAALPKGNKLVVKEHPSTFLRTITEHTRDKSFYRAIASLPQVMLAPIDEDPFNLIDNSIAVATLTGKAGFQALCRNRPVLVFGAAPYRECPGVYTVNNINQVASALETILSDSTSPTIEELNKYLLWVERYSVGDLNSNNDDPYDRDSRFGAKLKVWEFLIRAEIEPRVISFSR